MARKLRTYVHSIFPNLVKKLEYWTFGLYFNSFAIYKPNKSYQKDGQRGLWANSLCMFASVKCKNSIEVDINYFRCGHTRWLSLQPGKTVNICESQVELCM